MYCKLFIVVCFKEMLMQFPEKVTMPKHVGANRRIYRLWNCAFVGVNEVMHKMNYVKVKTNNNYYMS